MTEPRNPYRSRPADDGDTYYLMQRDEHLPPLPGRTESVLVPPEEPYFLDDNGPSDPAPFINRPRQKRGNLYAEAVFPFRPGGLPMSTTLSPLVSEFETTEQEASYARWLQARVAASLADQRPPIPHDTVMAEMDAVIDQIESQRQDAWTA
jgi:hypothetical protein